MRHIIFSLKAFLLIPLTLIQLFLLFIFSKSFRTDLLDGKKKFGHHDNVKLFKLLARKITRIVVKEVGFFPHILIMFVILIVIIANSFTGANNLDIAYMQEAIKYSTLSVVSFYILIPFVLQMPSNIE